MSEQSTYKHGDIVWVKLGSNWWPGEVVGFDQLSEDVKDDIKKHPPLASVTFFQEDSYEFIKNKLHIFPYNCPKKDDFIKKGMDQYRNKKMSMEKFPADVCTAEKRTDGNVNILADPKYGPEKKKENIAALIFGTPSPNKKGKDSPKGRPKNKSSAKKTPVRSSRHITHPRFIGAGDDHQVIYKIQSPAAEIDSSPSKMYNCSTCNFTSSRIDVIVLHNKSHMQGIYTPPSSKKIKRTPKKVLRMSTSKTNSIDEDLALLEQGLPITDGEGSEEDVPVVKQRKKADKKSSKKGDKKKVVAADDKKVVKTDIRVDLLAEWDDNDDEFDGDAQLDVLKGEDSAKKSEIDQSCFDFDDDDDKPIVSVSPGRKIPRVIPEKSKSIDELDKVVDKNELSEILQIIGITQLTQDNMNKDDSQEAKNEIKAILDIEQSADIIETESFSEEKESVVIIYEEKKCDKSNDLNDIISDDNLQKTEENDSQKKKIESNVEDGIDDILEATIVPKIPEIPQLLKYEQNFHNTNTIKFPDKDLQISVPDPKPKVVATKLTNPKKRFVKSFEDFELSLRAKQGASATTTKDYEDIHYEEQVVEHKLVDEVVEDATLVIDLPVMERREAIPAAPVEEAKYTTVVEEAKPTTVVEEAIPITVVEEAKPTTGVEEARATIVVEEAKPTTAVEEATPTTVEEEAKSTTVVEEVKPTTILEEAKPTTVVAKPITVVEEAKLTNVVEEAKPKTFVEAKPTTVVEEVKLVDNVIEGQVKMDDRKTRRSTRAKLYEAPIEDVIEKEDISKSECFKKTDDLINAVTEVSAPIEEAKSVIKQIKMPPLKSIIDVKDIDYRRRSTRGVIIDSEFDLLPVSRRNKSKNREKIDKPDKNLNEHDIDTNIPKFPEKRNKRTKTADEIKDDTKVSQKNNKQIKTVDTEVSLEEKLIKRSKHEEFDATPSKSNKQRGSEEAKHKIEKERKINVEVKLDSDISPKTKEYKKEKLFEKTKKINKIPSEDKFEAKPTVLTAEKRNKRIKTADDCVIDFASPKQSKQGKYDEIKKIDVFEKKPIEQKPEEVKTIEIKPIADSRRRVVLPDKGKKPKKTFEETLKEIEILPLTKPISDTKKKDLPDKRKHSKLVPETSKIDTEKSPSRKSKTFSDFKRDIERTKSCKPIKSIDENKSDKWTTKSNKPNKALEDSHSECKDAKSEEKSKHKYESPQKRKRQPKAFEDESKKDEATLTPLINEIVHNKEIIKSMKNEKVTFPEKEATLESEKIEVTIIDNYESDVNILVKNDEDTITITNNTLLGESSFNDESINKPEINDPIELYLETESSKQIVEVDATLEKINEIANRLSQESAALKVNETKETLLEDKSNEEVIQSGSENINEIPITKSNSDENISDYDNKLNSQDNIDSQPKVLLDKIVESVLDSEAMVEIKLDSLDTKVIDTKLDSQDKTTSHISTSHLHKLDILEPKLDTGIINNSPIEAITLDISNESTTLGVQIVDANIDKVTHDAILDTNGDNIDDKLDTNINIDTKNNVDTKLDPEDNTHGLPIVDCNSLLENTKSMNSKLDATVDIENIEVCTKLKDTLPENVMIEIKEATTCVATDYAHANVEEKLNNISIENELDTMFKEDDVDASNSKIPEISNVESVSEGSYIFDKLDLPKNTEKRKKVRSPRNSTSPKTSKRRSSHSGEIKRDLEIFSIQSNIAFETQKQLPAIKLQLNTQRKESELEVSKLKTQLMTKLHDVQQTSVERIKKPRLETTEERLTAYVAEQKSFQQRHAGESRRLTSIKKRKQQRFGKEQSEEELEIGGELGSESPMPSKFLEERKRFSVKKSRRLSQASSEISIEQTSYKVETTNDDISKSIESELKDATNVNTISKPELELPNEIMETSFRLDDSDKSDDIKRTDIDNLINKKFDSKITNIVIADMISDIITNMPESSTPEIPADNLNTTEELSAIKTLATLSELSSTDMINSEQEINLEKHLKDVSDTVLHDVQVEIATVPVIEEGRVESMTVANFSVDYTGNSEPIKEKIANEVRDRHIQKELEEENKIEMEMAILTDTNIDHHVIADRQEGTTSSKLLEILTDAKRHTPEVPTLHPLKLATPKLDHEVRIDTLKTKGKLIIRQTIPGPSRPNKPVILSEKNITPASNKPVILSEKNITPVSNKPVTLSEKNITPTSNKPVILSEKNITPVSNKPVILSEKIIIPAHSEYSSISVQKISAKRTYEDIEDIDAFIIQKPTKKTQMERVNSPTPPVIQKAHVRRPPIIKSKSKPTILGHHIIKPSGEVIQPKISQATQLQTKVQIPQITKTISQPATHSDEFDIDSMPIVLTDQILTPETIENMPMIIQETSKPQANKVITPIKTSTQQAQQQVKLLNKMLPLIKESFKPTTIAGKTYIKNIKSNVFQTNASTLKQSPTIISQAGKQGNFVIVPSESHTPTANRFTVGKRPMIKKTPTILASSSNKPTNLIQEPTGNKIMIVTNNQGQKSRVLLTPAQQKQMGYHNTPTKLIRDVSKSPNIIAQTIINPKGQITTTNTSYSPSGSSGSTLSQVMRRKIEPTKNKLLAGPRPSFLQGGLNQTKNTGQPRTIIIKNPQGQTVKRLQGTDDALLEQQVAEQIQAINRAANTKSQITYKPAKPSLPKRSYPKKMILPDASKISIQHNTKMAIQNKSQMILNTGVSSSNKSSILPPLAPISPIKKIERPIITKQTVFKPQKPTPVIESAPRPADAIPEAAAAEPDSAEPKRTPHQLVIQDGLGNQTMITEGQILALPSETTVDGQPQSYMLVTLDETGNLTPLNNEALMSLDPNLNLGGDLSNMILQIDQGESDTKAEQTLSIQQPQAETSLDVPATKDNATVVVDATHQEELSHQEMHISQDMQELPAAVEEELPVEQQPQVTKAAEVVPETTTLACQINNGEKNQQLIITGDPVATQKFLESLTEGNADLANILANAEGNILIHADGNQILINTDSEANSMLLAASTDDVNLMENNSNPIFASPTSKNQDILAAALAGTDVFQPEQTIVPSQSKVSLSQLSPGIYPMNVNNVLETSTMSSPIMTPLEIPTTNTKKIEDPTDVLTQLPKNVDLPITVTDPTIAHTVAQHEAALMAANEMHNSLELPPLMTVQDVAVTSAGMNSPSFGGYSLPNLDDSVDMNAKIFTSSISMPLLTEETEEAEDASVLVSSSSVVKVSDTLPNEIIEKQPDEIIEENDTSASALTLQAVNLVEENSSNNTVEDESIEPVLPPIKETFTTSSLSEQICSSLSEPPSEMFEFTIDPSYEMKTQSPITITTTSEDATDLMPENVSVNNLDKCEDTFEKTDNVLLNVNTTTTLEVNSPSISTDDSCEIPVQPEIVTNSSEIILETTSENAKRCFEDDLENDNKKCKFD